VFLAAAQRGECVLEMIGDGVHLSPAIVLDMFEPGGRDNAVLVPAAMAAAGMADGDYVLGSQPVTVADGAARRQAAEQGAARILDLLDKAGLPDPAALQPPRPPAAMPGPSWGSGSGWRR